MEQHWCGFKLFSTTCQLCVSVSESPCLLNRAAIWHLINSSGVNVVSGFSREIGHLEWHTLSFSLSLYVHTHTCTCTHIHTHTYLTKWVLLEWLTGLPQWQAMNGKPKNLVVVHLQGWMSQVVFSRYWNPEEVDSNASKGMDLLARWELAGTEQNCSSSMSYIGFQQKVWPKSKACPVPQRSGLEVDPPTFNQAKYVIFMSHRCALSFWMVVHSGCGQVDKQE